MAAPNQYLIVNAAGKTVGAGSSPDGSLPPAAHLAAGCTAVVCTAAELANWQWCTVADGVITQGVAPPPSIKSQAKAAQAAPYYITSPTLGLAGPSPATAGVPPGVPFAADSTALDHLNSEINAILLNGTFADGTATVTWTDSNNGEHAFTVPQFKIFASTLGAYPAALFKCIQGTLTVLPLPSITIA